MTSRASILQLLGNDERNLRALSRDAWSSHAQLRVIADCATRLLAARDTAPDLEERAEDNLRRALELWPEAR